MRGPPQHQAESQPVHRPVPLQADQISRIEAGIYEILAGQEAASLERQHHAQTITAELDDLTDIAVKTVERVDSLEQDHQAIRDDHNTLRLEIEQRVNRTMWWMLAALSTGLIGLFYAVIKLGL